MARTACGDTVMPVLANYDPRMKREGLHYVVVERDEKYMASLTGSRSSSKKWTKHWLKLVLYLSINGELTILTIISRSLFAHHIK